MNSSQRQIRVFVSSTFRDMHAERDHLVKYTFPELRRRCRERGVEFVEVDLRWGVTEEQAQRGEVLPVCLAEVERCRPYFVGILGERYGWIPQSFPQELLEHLPWLAGNGKRSLTELEILHGVLNNPEMAGRAFFYFRDPGYVDSIDPPYRANFVAEGVSERDRLSQLKDRIRRSGLPLIENYPNPVALGEHVQRQLWAAIDQEFPAGSEPDPLDREAAEHQAFADMRVRVYQGHAADLERLDQHVNSAAPPLVVVGASGSGKSALLANWACHYRAQHPDVFMFQHFIGSSADSSNYVRLMHRLLAEIKRHYQLPDELPATVDGLRAEFPSWLGMAAARGKWVLVLDALNQLEDTDSALELGWLPESPPPEARIIVSTLPGVSREALRRRAWSEFVVSGFEGLDERRRYVSDYLAQYRKQLSPARIDRIASAPQTQNPLYLRVLLEELRVFGVHEQLDKRMEHYLRAQTVAELYQRVLARIELDYEGGHPGLVHETLALLWAARRGLSEPELLEFLKVPRAEWSPLFLVLEESLVSRSGLLTFFHDYLRSAVVERYLSAESQQRAIHLRLAEYFAAAEKSERNVAELLWQLARAGEWLRLAEGMADPSILQPAWKSNEFDIKHYWVLVEGQSSMSMVASYTPVLQNPAEWDDVHVSTVATLLQDTGHPQEALTLWEYLVSQYRQSGDVAKLQSALGFQAFLLQERGALDVAMALHNEREQLCRDSGGLNGLQRTFGHQALILTGWGRYQQALALLQEKELICRQLGNASSLQSALGNQAAVFMAQNDLERAMQLYQEQERICRNIGRKDSLAHSLGNQALILKKQGRLPEAEACHQREEQICREIGDKSGLMASIGNRAGILRDQHQLDAAVELLKQQEQLCRELGSKIGLAHCLGNQAVMLRGNKRLEEALLLHQQEEQLYRELDNKDGVQISLGNQAMILMDLRRYDQALTFLVAQEQICRQHHFMNGLQRCLLKQARILRQTNQLQKAKEILEEHRRICREHKLDDGLRESLALESEWRPHVSVDNAMLAGSSRDSDMRRLFTGTDQVALQRAAQLQQRVAAAYDNKQYETAYELAKQQEKIYQQLGIDEGVKVSVQNQNVIAQALASELEKPVAAAYANNEYETAFKLVKQHEQIYRRLEFHEGVKTTLQNQDVIVRALMSQRAKASNDWQLSTEAISWFQEMERICRELNNTDQATFIRLQAEALLHQQHGASEEALQLYRREAELLRTRGDRSALIRCLGNQAAILYDQNHTAAALESLRDQARLCRESKALDELKLSLGNQVLVVRKLISQEAEGRGDQTPQNILVWLQTLEQLYRELGDTTNVILVMHEQALNHKSRDQTEEVMRLCKEEERLCRGAQDGANLANCLCEQAVALYGWRCYRMAYKLTQEQIQICRASGDIGGSVIALYNAAVQLLQLKDRREARTHAEEAQRLAQEHGQAELAARIRAVLEALRSAADST